MTYLESAIARCRLPILPRWSVLFSRYQIVYGRLDYGIPRADWIWAATPADASRAYLDLVSTLDPAASTSAGNSADCSASISPDGVR